VLGKEEDIDMSKSIASKMAATKKFLEKNGKSNLNLKQAQTAFADAERVTTELASLKSRLSELIETRKRSLGSLDQAVARVKQEKRLKAKEAKVQAKLAVLASPPSAAK
jgi:hypothetical protein